MENKIPYISLNHKPVIIGHRNSNIRELVSVIDTYLTERINIPRQFGRHVNIESLYRMCVVVESFIKEDGASAALLPIPFGLLQLKYADSYGELAVEVDTH